MQSSDGGPDQHSEEGEGGPGGWPSGQCQSKWIIVMHGMCVFG